MVEVCNRVRINGAGSSVLHVAESPRWLQANKGWHPFNELLNCSLAGVVSICDFDFDLKWRYSLELPKGWCCAIVIAVQPLVGLFFINQRSE